MPGDRARLETETVIGCFEAELSVLAAEAYLDDGIGTGMFRRILQCLEATEIGRCLDLGSQPPRQRIVHPAGQW